MSTPVEKTKAHNVDRAHDYQAQAIAHRQWVYLTCSHCGHQNSHEHLHVWNPDPQPLGYYRRLMQAEDCLCGASLHSADIASYPHACGVLIAS